MITPDSSNRETIESLLARLLTDDSSDFPVQAPGLVRTLLMQEDLYSLGEERNEALCDHSLARAVPTFYLKSLLRDVVSFEPLGESSPAIPMPFDPVWTMPDEELAEHGWSRRIDEDYWWRGTWSRGERPEHRFQLLDALDDPGKEPLLLEHVLLDGAGAWAIVFSDEDHAFLISDKATSLELLDVWDTTPTKELAEFEDYARRCGYPIQRRILAHARAGAWT